MPLGIPHPQLVLGDLEGVGGGSPGEVLYQLQVRALKQVPQVASEWTSLSVEEPSESVVAEMSFRVRCFQPCSISKLSRSHSCCDLRPPCCPAASL